MVAVRLSSPTLRTRAPRTHADPFETVRPPLLDEALTAIEAGLAPDREQAVALLDARGSDLDRLLVVAGAVRDRGLEKAGRPGTITYSRKVFIPLTHLCQDRCHYCVFTLTPGQLARQGLEPYLDEASVLEIAHAGAKAGCKEALLTLGDRPENRWSAARKWLDEHGYRSTLDYVAAMARLVRNETGLLPHLNPGVMHADELRMLRPTGPSMGMMLETISERIWQEPGGAHFGSPDKDPKLRLRVIEEAGKQRIPFTTGVLLGIGETPADRIDAICALKRLSEQYGHIQEIIVQNFRAKPATAMMGEADLETQEYAAAVAVARVLLGENERLQAPPNLTDPGELGLLIRAGIDDWGGVSPVTPDHVNPERPWPELVELARLTALGGFVLRERLTVHPHYVREQRAGTEWIDPALATQLLAQADPEGLALEDVLLSVENVRGAGHDDIIIETDRPAPHSTHDTTSQKVPT